MKYLSVCSGIEAASVAWSPLGWQPVAFSEIDRFPNSVLAHHYPDVPNWGDMEKFNEWPRSVFDVLVGGTPCQSFSVAGLRGGLADPRGNLALGFLGVLERFHPRWFIWENVPGAFSSVSHDAPDAGRAAEQLRIGHRDGWTVFDSYEADETHAFACMLAGFSELGYGWAYRVLDAQYFGVPQRRRRIFVVGHIGAAWQRAGAVLFERDCLFRNPPPSRKARTQTAGTLTTGIGRRRGSGQGFEHLTTEDELAGTLGSRTPGGGTRTTDLDGHGAYVPEIVRQAMSAKWHKGSSGPAGDEHHNLIAETLTERPPYSDRGSDTNLITEDPIVYQCHGGNVGPVGTLRVGKGDIGSVPFTFDEAQITSPENRSNPQPGDPSGTLTTDGRPPTVAYSITPESGQGADLRATETDLGHALGTSRNERGTRIVEDVKQVQWSSGGGSLENDTAQALRADAEHNYQFIRLNSRVRRLTPTECERLMGFPDGYTDVPGASDSARYRALGNSIVIPVLEWIGERIEFVDAIPQ